MKIKLGRLSLILAACLCLTAGLSIFAGPTLAARRPAHAAGKTPAVSTRCPGPDKGAGSAVLAQGLEPGRTLPSAEPARARRPRTAREFARNVLAEAAIPRSSVHTTISPKSILAAPVETPAIKGLTDLHHAYKVHQTAAAVLAYEKRHLPRGARLAGIGRNCDHGKDANVVLLSVPVSGSHEYSATLALGVAALGKHSALLRVDAQVSWVASRPAAERPPAGGVLQLTFQGSPAVGQVQVTLSAAQQRAVTKLLNSLPIGAAAQCAERDPLYQLQYISASGSPAFSADGYGCAGTVLASVKGRTVAPLHDRNLSLVRLIDSFRPGGQTIFGTVSSGNWAGWTITPPPAPRRFQVASATWNVPAVSCDPFEMAAASEWVGIDGTGAHASTVEQAGTETDCVLGQGTYHPWWELFGWPNRSDINDGAAVYLSGDLHIHPGDIVSVEVVAGQGSGGAGFPGANQYLFSLANLTEHWSTTMLQPPVTPLSSPVPPNQSVEWIVEQPSCFWTCQALAQYGHVTFNGMDLGLDTFAFPFGAIFPPGDPNPPGPFNGQESDLISGSTVKATGSPLLNENEELVTWLHK
jgi:hypothetical protein